MGIMQIVMLFLDVIPADSTTVFPSNFPLLHFSKIVVVVIAPLYYLDLRLLWPRIAFTIIRSRGLSSEWLFKTSKRGKVPIKFALLAAVTLHSTNDNIFLYIVEQYNSLQLNHYVFQRVVAAATTRSYVCFSFSRRKFTFPPTLKSRFVPSIFKPPRVRWI